MAVARAQAEQNRELGFDVRGALAAGGGRYLLQGRRHQLLSALGLSVNREKPLEGESTNNLEAVLALTYDLFSLRLPEGGRLRDLAGFASLTDWGRTRVELDVRVKRELLKDFTVSFRVYESYDSRPPTEGSRPERLRRQLRPGLDLLKCAGARILAALLTGRHSSGGVPSLPWARVPATPMARATCGRAARVGSSWHPPCS